MKNPALALLTGLASLDEKLQRVDKRRREQEDAVTAAASALLATETHLADRHEEITRLKKEADALNLDVRTAEGEVERFDVQLLGAKSNKEYDILRRQLEAEQAKKSKLEDEVLERLERADVVAEEEAAAKAALEEATKSLDEKKKTAESVEGELAQEESSLRQEREGIVSGLDAETRHRYDSLLAQRRDSAMSKVVDGVCSACARKLTPQLANLVDIGEEIVQCMSCQRILYLDESGP
ncbi:MAG: zinc ribbon domain-containing protein [Planctomycetota bacterium]